MEIQRVPLRLVTPLPDAVTEPVSVEQLFRAHARYVAAIAHRLLGRGDDVDDVVQEVFLSAVEGLGRLRDRDAVKGWLATVTVRTARRKLRLRRFWAFLGADEGHDYEAVASNGASPEDRALLARVYAVLDRIGVEQRLAWVLRHVEGEKLERVAELTGCSLATAKRRIAAAEQAIEGVLGHE